MKLGETVYSGFGDLPNLDPIIAHETTEDGWRGLTENGEIFEVHGRNGHKATPPDEPLLVMRGGKPLGYRALEPREGVSIAEYCQRFDRAAALFRNNDVASAIAEADATVAIAPTVHARYNRAFMLLSVGRWQEGFADYAACEEGPPFQRPQCKAAIAAGLVSWRGEPLQGKRLLVVHAHGFGDSIMALRYVAALRRQEFDVLMQVPRELEYLAGQVGPVSTEIKAADYFCPFLMLPHLVGLRAPDQVMPNLRLEADPELVKSWRERLGKCNGKRRVGIAWSVGQHFDGDYPRAVPLAELIAALPDAELHNVQVQGSEEAAAYCVRTHDFNDFADCAALMACLDEIVSVDTAAAHLAGALERPTTLLLSHWHSWRWLANWYPTMTMHRQAAPGDWASALHGLATSHQGIVRHDSAARPV